jgi:hypothetical protein
MKKTLSLLISAGAVIAILASCETGAETGKPSKAAGFGKKLVSQATSVVSSNPEEYKAIEKIARYKCDAERLAKTAPATAESSYNSLGSAIDAWIFAKGAEATRLGAASLGQVDLSTASASEVSAAFDEFKKAAEVRGSRPESAAAAALVTALFDKLRRDAKEARKESAQSLKETLRELKLSSWKSIHS